MSAWAVGWRTTSRNPSRSSGIVFAWSILPVLSSSAAEARGIVQEPELGMDRLDVDRVGLEEPLDEEAVERRERDDREPTALRGIGHDLTEAAFEHLADRPIELLEARP